MMRLTFLTSCASNILVMNNPTSSLYTHLEANDVEFNLATLCAPRSTQLGSKCQSFAKCEMLVVGDFFLKCTLTMRLSSSPTMMYISSVFVVDLCPYHSPMLMTPAMCISHSAND